MAERQPDGSLYVLPEPSAAHELIERLAGGDGVVIERIVSTGQGTPVGEWLEQDRDEWVVLLEGEAALAFDDGSRLQMRSGDHVLIPAGERHRVEWTRKHPPCVWLAVHAAGLATTGGMP